MDEVYGDYRTICFDRQKVRYDRGFMMPKNVEVKDFGSVSDRICHITIKKTCTLEVNYDGLKKIFFETAKKGLN